MRSTVFLLGLFAYLGASAVDAAVLPAYVTAALSDPVRPQSDRQRDATRKPGESIVLAGLKPGDRVADVYPGGGYYSRIFSRVVGPGGSVYAILPQVIATPDAVAYTKSQLADAALKNVTVMVEPLDAIGTARSLDVVWVAKVYHDLPNVEMGPADIAAMNRAIFNALKPGGAYVVTDHAAAPGSGFLDIDPDNAGRKHRIDPVIVKRQVMAAGFVLEAESNLLANPADDHAASVFDPSIRGKTDQFFFVFRKPR